MSPPTCSEPAPLPSPEFPWDSTHRNATAFEYLEEFPMQMLAQLESLTGKTARHGLFVINMEYGKNFSGPEKDVFYYDRSVAHIEDAWRSNFLHPVIYYYRHLPTGELASTLPELSLLRGSPSRTTSVYTAVTTRPCIASAADRVNPRGPT